MNTNEILQLIQTLKETGFKHIDVSHEGSHVLLSNTELQGGHLTFANMSHQSAPVQSTSPIMTSPQNYRATATKDKPTEEIVNKEIELVKEQAGETKALGGHIVESPIVGTFYAASGPDVDDFVSVGSKVKKGDVLCIIEAMKLMNEIEADISGEIVEILVQNEAGVEYGQALFRIV
jgi:acetyl-CoA carboxylase biotin carboxyl carrier protein